VRRNGSKAEDKEQPADPGHGIPLRFDIDQGERTFVEIMETFAGIAVGREDGRIASWCMKK
jgi:hypothetical protein